MGVSASFARWAVVDILFYFVWHNVAEVVVRCGRRCGCARPDALTALEAEPGVLRETPWYGTAAKQGTAALVTGATGGLGIETVKYLAGTGCHVLAAGRNNEALARVCAGVRVATGNEGVEPVHLDLASFASVREAAGSILATMARKKLSLRVVVLNAAVLGRRRTTTEDGHEEMHQVNHLSHWLLLSLLLPHLKRVAPSRVVILSSIGHAFGQLRISDLEWEQRFFVGALVYGVTKLSNLLTARELHRQLEEAGEAGDDDGVRVVAAHPGIVGSQLYRGMRLLHFLRDKLSVFKTPEEGARTQVYACVAPANQVPGGSYLVDCAAMPTTSQGNDMVLAARLWEATQEVFAPHSGGGGDDYGTSRSSPSVARGASSEEPRQRAGRGGSASPRKAARGPSPAPGR